MNECFTNVKNNPDNMKEQFCMNEMKINTDNINSLESTLQRIIECIEGGKSKNLQRATGFAELNRIAVSFYFAYNHTVNSRFEMVKNSLQKINDRFQTNILPSQVEIYSAQQKTDNINKNSDHLLSESTNDSEKKANEVPQKEVSAKIEAKNSNSAPAQEPSNLIETTTPQVAVDKVVEAADLAKPAMAE